VYMWHNSLSFRLPETGPVILLLLVLASAFFVGHFITGFMRRLGGGILPAWFQDIQAWFALLSLLLLGVEVIVRMVINTSLPWDKQLDLKSAGAVLAGLVGFYFGARS